MVWRAGSNPGAQGAIGSVPGTGVAWGPARKVKPMSSRRWLRELAVVALGALAGCGIYQTVPLEARHAAEYGVTIGMDGSSITLKLEAVATTDCRSIDDASRVTLNGQPVQVTRATETDTGCMDNRLSFDGTLDPNVPLTFRIADATGVAEFVTTHPYATRGVTLLEPADGHLLPGQPVRLAWTPTSDVIQSALLLVQTAISGPQRMTLTPEAGGILSGTAVDLTWIPAQQLPGHVDFVARAGVITCNFARCVPPPVRAGPPDVMVSVGQ